MTKTACVVTKDGGFPKGSIKVDKPATEKVSLRRRIEVLEEDLYKLKKEIFPLFKEMEKIKDDVGISS